MIDRVRLLTELVVDAEQSRRRAEEQYAEAETRVALLGAELERWRKEETAFREALQRIAPESIPEVTMPAEQEPTTPEQGLEDEDDYPGAAYLNDWSSLPRTVAVEDAVRQVLRTEDFASPSAVERVLREHRRDDDRDSIGSALSYLNKKERIRNQGRGQWVLFMAGQTSEDTADTVPSDLQESEREEV